MPHLAARILAALGAVVPAPLCGLVAWELLLAGADSSAHEVLAGAVPGARPTVATRAASGLLGAAWRGDEASFTDAATRLQRATEGVALLARDAASLLSAIDPHADPDTLPKDTREWVAGALPITPPALCGLCMPDVDDDGNEIAGAFVLLRTDADARRVLRPALGLVDPSAARGHSLAHARTNTALSILAFAGSEGLTDRELFHAVYGFEYEPAQHGSALRQLVRRMREEIGDRAAIDRTGGGYALLPLVTCAIPDPRCAPETDELILRFLAARGGRASAREVATALGIALRTVQLALKHLVDDGACEAVRKGRAVEYELEDTTFANPTLTRLSPKGA
jgi:DNA-binding transcriptional ArsR family regulator